jgi:mannose-6-phosphate isomerase-like protein (cupin superfamily)
LIRNDLVNEQLPRSPYDMVGGVIYFPRMLDKIRLYARGVLPEAYHNNMGREFDGNCLTFLHVQYSDLRERVLAGGSDEEILEWCFVNGRRPNTGEIEIFNSFMLKAGWRDPSGGRIGALLQQSGLAYLDRQCATRFDFIEFDEGRTPPDFRKWEPPRLDQTFMKSETGLKASLAEWKLQLPLAATTKWAQGVWDIEALRHGSMSAILFTPRGSDYQETHTRDEIYVVVAGSADLFLAEKSGEHRLPCITGDVLFVPAGMVHNFERISDDFVTWAVFWGPDGGEAEQSV